MSNPIKKSTPKPLESSVVPPPEPKPSPRRASRNLSPEEKCKAVLALWSGAQSANALCRELAVQRPQLERWEQLALEGMLKQLENPRQAGEAPKAKLPKHLERLLERQLSKLATRELRLTHLQEKHSGT